jgi:hypothetical protein
VPQLRDSTVLACNARTVARLAQLLAAKVFERLRGLRASVVNKSHDSALDYELPQRWYAVYCLG